MEENVTHIEMRANRKGRRMFWEEEQIERVRTEAAIDILEVILSEMRKDDSIHISSGELVAIVLKLKESL